METCSVAGSPAIPAAALVASNPRHSTGKGADDRRAEIGSPVVTVNAVAPGPTATPLFLDGKPHEVVDRLTSMSPLERLGEPGDIAEDVAFLAGSGRRINGQTINANGGVV